MKYIIEKYFNSSWIPIVIYLLLSGILSVIYEEKARYIAFLLFLGILVSGIVNAFNKRWANALPNLFFSLSLICVLLLIMG